MKRRGTVPVSETGHVAILILLIALMIIGYFILLPAEEKEDVLGIEAEEGTGAIEVVLSETPGHIYPYTSETDEKNIAPLNLYSTLKTASKKLSNRVYIRRNIFTGKSQVLDFVLEDLDALENLGLFFNIIKTKGDLVISINDEEIFRGEVVAGDLPISIPLDYLKLNNELKIYVSNPSWRFLSTNYYDLKDVQLIKSYTLENRKEDRNFIVYDREKVKKAKLEFYVNCMDVGVYNQGLLDISLNGAGLFNGRIQCVTDKITLDLDKGYLRNGQNTLTFGITEGSYMFEHMILNLDLEKEYYPEYYFAIDDLKGSYDLVMDFAEDELKRATIIVNNRELSLATEDMDYTKDVTDYLVEGENHIKIIGISEFTITDLEVIQEK